mmetsp:Transcript_16934/g.36707  ORF Transcript_16934/g.36707 Transcript_16934/m.36707 type:complete len:119 (-) Transcript_16934:26-382(-)
MQSLGIERGWTAHQSRSFLWQQHEQCVILVFFGNIWSHATNNATGGNRGIVEGQRHEDGESCARVCHHDIVLRIWKEDVWRSSVDSILHASAYIDAIYTQLSLLRWSVKCNPVILYSP